MKDGLLSRRLGNSKDAHHSFSLRGALNKCEFSSDQANANFPRVSMDHC